MKRAFKILLITLLLCLIPMLAFANEGTITSEQYLLFSDLVYNNLDDYKGKKIEDFIGQKDVIKKNAKRTYKNKTGTISSVEVMKAYLKGFYVDEIFKNENDGFYGVAFKNPETKDIVLAFRGTADLYGGINDIEFGLLSINSSQMIDALNITTDYITKNKDTFNISTTGHSLGGGIALELSHFYHFKSETFNAAQMTKALYYNNKGIYGAVYQGFDTWNHVDHVNEDDFVVGTFEYSLSKKAKKHANASKHNRFFAHSVNHLIDIEGNDIKLMTTTSEDYLSDLDEIAFNVNKNGLMLGSSTNNFIKSQKLFNSNDIIYAGDGDDVIEAGGGDDYIIGGAGDDVLDGGAGDDIYAYYDGQGEDTIIDPLGNDSLVIFSKGDIEYLDTEYFYLVKQNGKVIANIDKVARIDNFSSSDNSFTVVDMNTNETHKIQLNTPEQELRKIKILYAGDVDVCDLDGNVLLTIHDERGHQSLPNLSAYYSYDEYYDTYAKYFYIAEAEYQLVAHKSSKKENILIDIDHKDADGTVAKYTAGDIPFTDTVMVDLTGNVPEYHINNRIYYFTKTKYTDIEPLQVKKRVIFTCEHFGGKIQSVISPAEKDNLPYVEYWSSDESVVSVDRKGKYKAHKAGSAIIIMELDGYRAMVRIFVFDFEYIAVFTTFLAFILAAILTRIHHKRRMKRFRPTVEM